MEPSDALKQILPAFEQYYTVKKDNITPPFCNEAEFRSHNEQYFLVRSAHIADIDSNEFVYFADPDELTDGKLGELVNAAWTTGLAKVRPYNGHRNSDVLFLFSRNRFLPKQSRKSKKQSFINPINSAFTAGATLSWLCATPQIWKFIQTARARITQSSLKRI